MSQNLIVVQNRQQMIYLYAYCKQFGDGRKFDIVSVGEFKIPRSLIKLCEQANMTIVNLGIAQKKHYEKMIVSSYGHFATHKTLINSISYIKLCYFADMLGNTLFDASYGSLKVSELICFGFYKKYETFLLLCQGAREASISLVSLSEIKKAWNEIADLHLPASKQESFEHDDTLIALRYWGNSLIYPFAPNVSFSDFISAQEIFAEQSGRIIIRRDPRDFALNFEEFFSRIKKEHNSVIDYDSTFENVSDFPELSSPEALLFRSSVGPKNLLALDGTLSIAAWFNFPNCKVFWIDHSQIENIFESDLEVNLVIEHINSWKCAIEILKSANLCPTISVVEVAQNLVINKLIFKHFEQISILS